MSTSTRSCFCGGCSSCMIWRANDEVADLKAKLSAALLQVRELKEELDEYRGGLAAVGIVTATPRQSLIDLFQAHRDHHDEHHRKEEESNRLINEFREECARARMAWKSPKMDSSHTSLFIALLDKWGKGPIREHYHREAPCDCEPDDTTPTENPKCDHEWMDGGEDETAGAVDICKNCGISFHQVHTEKPKRDPAEQGLIDLGFPESGFREKRVEPPQNDAAPRRDDKEPPYWMTSGRHG